MVDVRNLVVQISAADTATSVVENLRNLLDEFKASIALSFDTSATTDVISDIVNVDDTIKNVSSTTVEAQSVFDDFGNRAKEAVGAIKDGVDDFTSSIGGMIASMSGMAAGGAVAGFSWLDASKAKLYAKEVYGAIDASKSFGVTSQQVQEQVNSMTAEAPGWITSANALKQTYDMLAMGGKYLKTGVAGLAQTEVIGKFAFANQELTGGMSAEDLIKQATRTAGKMQGRFGIQFAAKIGLKVSDTEMATAKSRVEYLLKKGGAVNIETALDERPWVKVENNLATLKKKIGESIGGPLAAASNAFSDLVVRITSIPGGSSLLGWAAILTALAGTISLLIGVFTPFIALLGTLKAIMLGQAVAAEAVALTEGQAGVMALFEATANQGLAASFLEAASAAWTAAAAFLAAALANPLTWVIIAIAAIGLLAYKMGWLQKAWDAFTGSAIGKDLINWFNSLGYLAVYVLQVVNALWSTFKKSDIFTRMVASLNSIFDTIMGVLGAVDTVYGFLKGGGQYKIDLSWVGKSLETVANKETKGIFTFLQLLYYFLYDYVRKIHATFVQFGNWLHGVWDTLLSMPHQIAKAIADIGTAAEKKVTTALAPVTQPFKNVGNVAYDLAKSTASEGDQSFSDKSLPDIYESGGTTETLDNAFSMLGSGVASGGEVITSGIAKVHAGEPIVPASISKSSNLISVLSNIAKTPTSMSSDSSNHVTIGPIYISGATSSNVTSSGFDRNTEYKLRKFIDEIVQQSSRHRMAH